MDVKTKHLVLATIGAATVSALVQAYLWAGWVGTDDQQRQAIAWYLLAVDIIIIIAFVAAAIKKVSSYTYEIICVVNLSLLAAIGVWVLGVGIAYAVTLGFGYGATMALKPHISAALIRPSS